MREIRMLRAMWRALETGSRTLLTGHEGGNAGHRQEVSYGSPRQCSTLPGKKQGNKGCFRMIFRRDGKHSSTDRNSEWTVCVSDACQM